MAEVSHHDRWVGSAQLFREFVAEHGHANMPQKYTVGDVRLGMWLHNQRHKYRHKNLRLERVAALFDIHPKWDDATRQAGRWENAAQLFREFVAEHGHANMPQKYTVGDVKLGVWLHNQRQKYRRGNLNLKCTAKLFDIHPEWDNPKATTTPWETSAQLFREFVAEHGHANMPQKYTVGDVRLGMWLSIQRHKYRHKNLRLERVAALFDIHPKWDDATGQAGRWENAAQLFREFVAEYGHPNVPQSYAVGGVRLGIWVSGQRQKYRRGNLNLKCTAKLFDIHPEWDNPKAATTPWETSAKLFREFVAEYGHPNVPQSYIMGDVRLGMWLSIQRHKYRRGNLNPGRAATLHSIHPDWGNINGRAAQWETSAKLFREFVAEHGHPNVPQKSSVDGVKLGAWLCNQRQKYRRGDLTAERATALFDIHPDWSSHKRQ